MPVSPAESLRVLGLGLVLACVGCSRESPPPSNTDVPAAPPEVRTVRPDDLQGKWKLVKMERNGREMDISKNYATRGLNFTDHRVLLLNTATGAETDTRLVVTAHEPGASPGRFDLTAGAGHPSAGKVIPCIYTRSGDELVLMMGEPGEARPETLDTTKVVGIEKQTFRRIPE